MNFPEYKARTKLEDKLETGDKLYVRELKEYPGIIVADIRSHGIGLLRRRVQFNEAEYNSIAAAVEAWRAVNAEATQS